MTDRVLPASEAVPATATGNDAAPGKLTNIPGFRFHPTDEELISYYLKRKVQGKPIRRLDAIGEVDIYKHEPSDLPELSRLKTKDQQWFFLSTLEKKYIHGALINRATKEGYWNKTGEDKVIRRDGQAIGIVKSLVFHRGRAPMGQGTDWVIHEYHLVDDGQGLEMNAYVLCRLFRKQHAWLSGGFIDAPFSEQEWDDDGERAPVSSLVHTNRINEKIQQENHSQSMKLIDLNELPREFERDDDPKTVDPDDDNDEPLTRGCLPLCVLNTEAPLPLIHYKRKYQIDSFNSYDNSSQTTQDHFSFPATTSETIPSVSAKLEENEPESVATMVPTSSSTELIKDLQKEKQQMTVERETYNLDMMNAEAMLRVPRGQIDALRAENEELKKNNSNKRQCS